MLFPISDVRFVFMNNLSTWKRGTKLNYTRDGKTIVVTYFKKVRNSDELVEVLMGEEGYHQVNRGFLTEVK